MRLRSCFSGQSRPHWRAPFVYSFVQASLAQPKGFKLVPGADADLPDFGPTASSSSSSKLNRGHDPCLPGRTGDGGRQQAAGPVRPGRNPGSSRTATTSALFRRNRDDQTRASQNFIRPLPGTSGSTHRAKKMSNINVPLRIDHFPR